MTTPPTGSPDPAAGARNDGAATARARRSARVVLALVALVVVAAGVTAVAGRGDHGGSGDSAAGRTATGLRDAGDPTGRTSRRIVGGERDVAAPEAAPDSARTDPAPVVAPVPQPDGSGAASPGGTGTGTGDRPATRRTGVVLVPAGEGGRSSGPPAGGPASAPVAPVGDPMQPGFHLPGDDSVEPDLAGPVGPEAPEDETDEDPGPTTPEPAEQEAPPQDDLPVDDPPTEPVVLDPDEVGCPNLDLYPIGGYVEGAPASYEAIALRFRDLAPVEWTKPALVCAHPLEPWRDLVVQRLVSEGLPDGAIITAADGSSAVMRLTEIEWTSYRFRYGGGPVGPNLLGHPVDRIDLGTTHVIRTTGGALVFARSDSIGLPLVGGAFDRWMGSGGPDGPMGMPVGIPEAATGPDGATRWQPDGPPATGARQDFANGWLFLPGVLTDVEAAAQPADRYEWHPTAVVEEPPVLFDYRGHIMQSSGVSYYVDLDGVRHWIRTTSDWSCARWDLGATEYAVQAHELARYVQGVQFDCDDYR